MLISLARMSKLRESLKKFDDGHMLNAEEKIVFLGKCSSASICLSEVGKLEPSLYRYLISIGTAFRRGSATTSNIAYSLLNTICIFEFEKSIINFNDTRYLIFETIRKLRLQSDYFDNEYSLLWHDEKSAVNSVIIDLEKSSKEDVNNTFRKLSRELMAFAGAPNLPGDFKHKIQKLFTMGNDPDKNRSILALSALAYLSKSNDLVDDRAGIFGLADDLFVIDKIYDKLFDVPVGNRLLNEFLETNNTPLAVLLEKNLDSKTDDQSFALEPISHHLQLILGSLNYVEQDTKWLNLVLPETSLVVYLKIICDYLEEPESNDESSMDKLKPGDKRYFIRPNFALEFEYLGICDLTGKFKIRTSADSAVMRVDRQVIASSLCSPLDRKHILSCGTKINDYFNSAQNRPPPHLKITSNLDYMSLLLTQKNKYAEYAKSIRPFGIQFKDFISVQYISKNSVMPRNFPLESGAQLLVCSNAEVAVEILDEINKPLNIYCDDASLAVQFLSDLSDTEISKINSCIFISGSKDNQKINDIEKRGFSTFTLNRLLGELDVTATKQNFQDVISRSERLYIKCGESRVVEKRVLSSEPISNFLRLSKLLARQDRLEDLGLQRLIFMLGHFRSTCLGAWYPKSVVRAKNDHESYDKIVTELEYYSRHSEIVRDLHFEVVNGKSALLNANYTRSVDDTISKFGGKTFLLSQTNKDKFEAIHQLSETTTDEVSIISPSELFKGYLDGMLVVPSLQMGRETIRYLAQNRVSDALSLSLFPEEFVDYNIYTERGSLWSNKLENKTKDVFRRTTTARKNSNFFKKIEQKRETQDQSLEELEDSILAAQIQKIGVDNIVGGASTEALLFTLDQKSNFIFLPPNGEVFMDPLVGLEASKTPLRFETVSASSLSPGDTICIPQTGKTNLVEEIASHINIDFSQKRELAAKWKTALHSIWENCGNDLNKLQEILATKNIKRTNITLQKWLYDEEMVAPRNPEKNLKIIFSLSEADGTSSSCEEVLNAIKFVYNARQQATTHLLGLINAKKVYPDHNEFAIKIGDSSLSYSVHTVSRFELKKTISNNELWHVEQLDSLL